MKMNSGILIHKENFSHNFFDMQREGFKRVLIVMGILFAGFIYVGSVNAQNSTTTTSTTCSEAEYWCSSQKKCIPNGTMCDTSGSTGTTCPVATPIRCPDNTCAVVAGNCPSTTTTTCSSSQRLCASKSTCVDEWSPCDGVCTGGKYFCSYSDNSGGWCSSSPCTESQCASAGRKWCKNSVNTCSTASSGWCASSPSEICPPHDRASCEAVKGEWCGSGWCALYGNTCPAMTWPSDQTECELYKGTWCPPQQSTSGTAATCMMGSCMMAGQSCSKMYGGGTCWDGSTMNSSSGSYCPPMPTTKETCTATAGKTYWCENTSGGWSSGWCSMMPCNKDQCTAAGKFWCDSAGTYTSESSGWCSDMKCSPPGKMICPDGDTFVDRLKDCPKKGSEPTMKDCPDGTKVPMSSVCPEKKKTCSDGSMIAMDATCPTQFTCPSGTKVATSTDCPAGDYKECTGGKKVLKGTDCPKEEMEKLCSDSDDGSKCPLSEVEIQRMKKEIDANLKKLDSLETFFKGKEGIGDEYLEDIIDLRTELNALTMTLQGMNILKRQVSVRISELKNEKSKIERAKEEPLIEDLDEDNREEELRNVKRNIKDAERLFRDLSTRIGKLEKKTTMIFGQKETFVVPAGLKEIVDSAKTSIALIKKADTYNEAEEAIQDVQGHIESIESYQNSISFFLRTWTDEKAKKKRVYYHSDVVMRDIENFIKRVNAQVAVFEKSLKSSADKREYASFVSAVSEIMDAVKDQYKKFYKGEIEDEELKDIEKWAESAIFEKLEEVRDTIADAKGARKLTKFIEKMESSNNVYAKLLKKTKKVRTKSGKKTIVKTEFVIPKGSEKRQEAEQKMAALACFLTPKPSSDECATIQEQTEVDVLYLKDLQKVKKDEYAEKVLPVVAAAFSVLEELDGILGLAKKTSEDDAQEERRERFKDASTPSFDLKLQKTQDSLEDSDIRANFYRRNSLQEFARIINGKNVSYSQFAQNQ